MSVAAHTRFTIAVALVLLCGPIATAEAHTKLVSSLPVAGAQVVSPAELTLTFDTPPKPIAATLKDAGGREVADLAPAQQGVSRVAAQHHGIDSDPAPAWPPHHLSPARECA